MFCAEPGVCLSDSCGPLPTQDNLVLLIVLGMQHLGVDMNSHKVLLGAVVGQKDPPRMHPLALCTDPPEGIPQLPSLMWTRSGPVP